MIPEKSLFAPHLNKSLFTSWEQAALSSMRTKLGSVIAVILLYRDQESLKSSHSRASVSVLITGRSGAFVFVFVIGAVVESALAARSWLFSDCNDCS